MEIQETIMETEQIDEPIETDAEGEEFTKSEEVVEKFITEHWKSTTSNPVNLFTSVVCTVAESLISKGEEEHNSVIISTEILASKIADKEVLTLSRTFYVPKIVASFILSIHTDVGQTPVETVSMMTTGPGDCKTLRVADLAEKGVWFSAHTGLRIKTACAILRSVLSTSPDDIIVSIKETADAKVPMIVVTSAKNSQLAVTCL